jgi:hypothetical protein
MMYPPVPPPIPIKILSFSCSSSHLGLVLFAAWSGPLNHISISTATIGPAVQKVAAIRRAEARVVKVRVANLARSGKNIVLVIQNALIVAASQTGATVTDAQTVRAESAKIVIGSSTTAADIIDAANAIHAVTIEAVRTVKRVEAFNTTANDTIINAANTIKTVTIETIGTIQRVEARGISTATGNDNAVSIDRSTSNDIASAKLAAQTQRTITGRVAKVADTSTTTTAADNDNVAIVAGSNGHTRVRATTATQASGAIARSVATIANATNASIATDIACNDNAVTMVATGHNDIAIARNDNGHTGAILAIQAADTIAGIRATSAQVSVAKTVSVGIIAIDNARIVAAAQAVETVANAQAKIAHALRAAFKNSSIAAATTNMVVVVVGRKRRRRIIRLFNQMARCRKW